MQKFSLIGPSIFSGTPPPQYKIGFGGYVIIHTMAYEITYWVNILFDTGHMDTYIKDMLFHMMDR